MRRVGLAVVVALLLAARGQAAEPAAPDRLPSEVQGVVGSGDQLSLRLKDSAGGRTIKIGEVYSDGWSLTGLTATKATLAKDGAIREVGLNPTGALASTAPAAPPTTVTLVGIPDEATIAQRRESRASRPGQLPDVIGKSKFLTDAETRRMQAYTELLFEDLDRRRIPLTPAPFNSVNRRLVLGDAAATDLQAMLTKESEGETQDTLADLAVNPHFGPTSYPHTPGMTQEQAVAQYGLDLRGLWASERDAQGGATMQWYPDYRTMQAAVAARTASPPASAP